ncbi:MAG: L-threonylcarbamoyladenylate synthase [Fidelibacterota bacterium]
MTLRIIRLNDYTDTQRQELFRTLEKGEIIAYPTDTLYGLGVDIYQPLGVERLLALKGRLSDKPFSILYPNCKSLLADFDHLNDFQLRVVNRLLPGRVTLLLPVKSPNQFPAPFVSNGYIGVRVVDLPALNRLLAGYPHPISTTSVNPAGAKPACSVAEIRSYFPDQIKVVIDNGKAATSPGSTLLKLYTERWEILREGEVSAVRINQMLYKNK